MDRRPCLGNHEILVLHKSRGHPCPVRASNALLPEIYPAPLRDRDLRPVLGEDVRGIEDFCCGYGYEIVHPFLREELKCIRHVRGRHRAMGQEVLPGQLLAVDRVLQARIGRHHSDDCRLTDHTIVIGRFHSQCPIGRDPSARYTN